MKELLNSINSTDVVLDTALKFHEYSIDLYREISSNTQSSGLRELLISMAHEEGGFYSSIKGMIESKSGTAQNSTNLVGEYGSYISLILSKIIPVKSENAELMDTEIIHVTLQLEKNKLEFYEQTKKLFTLKDRNDLDQICGRISDRISLITELSSNNSSYS